MPPKKKAFSANQKIKQPVDSGQVASKSRRGGNSSYFKDDKNYAPFSAQLARIGLALKDVVGDGNCCFRALSDQLFGNEAQHNDIRQRTCQYMRQNRDQFQPFMAALLDDDETADRSFGKGGKQIDPYDKYIKSLETSGTYADNGCLVAFSRLYQLDIHIHQLDLDIWTISGSTASKKGQSNRQLHLAYHNGEHYSSVRQIDDSTNNPTNFRAEYLPHNPINKEFSQPKEYLDELIDEEQIKLAICQIGNVTNCHDMDLIADQLALYGNDVELTIESLLANMQIENWSEENGKQRMCAVKKSCAANKKEKKKLKKERQMERQQLKVKEQKQGSGSIRLVSDCNEDDLVNTFDATVLNSFEFKSI